MIFTIATRELRSLFLSPLAWVILAVTQLLLAWVFLNAMDVFFSLQAKLATIPNAPGVTDLVVSPLLETASILLLIISPLLTMRLLSEERRNRTLDLLIASPLSITEIVLGKYLGIVLFMLLYILMLSLMPLALETGTSLDIGKMLSGFFGLFLLLGAICAAGLYMSSLTDNPVIAAISSFGLLLLLWLMNNHGATQADASSVLNYLAITSHLSVFLRGLVRTADISYYLLFIVGFLVLTIRQLETRRLQA